MAGVKSFVKVLIVVLVVVIAGFFVVRNWSWVFAKKVSGEILDVKRVTDPSVVLGSRPNAQQLHSYSILIQGDDGKLYTASSEDRQWQVAAKGYCVDALLFVYPPWDFQAGGTYFNARLEQLKVCPGKSAPEAVPGTAPAEPPILPEPTEP